MTDTGAHMHMPAVHEPKLSPGHTSPQSSHFFGMHLVTYGARKGNCLCMDTCCHDPGAGCTCRFCAGIGHEFCKERAIARDKAALRRARVRKAARDGALSLTPPR